MMRVEVSVTSAVRWDGAAAGGVAQCVVEQVDQRLTQPQRVGGDGLLGCLHGEGDALVQGARGEQCGGGLEGVVERDGLSVQGHRAVAGAGEDKEVFCEVSEPVGLLRHAAQGGGEFVGVAGMAEGEIGFGA
jgi:hypothetical protein